MPDLEREPARYGTVYRDRAPAVRIDEVDVRLNRPSSSHRPVRATVTSAWGRTHRRAGAPSPTPGRSVSSASGAVPGPAVMAGGGALTVLTGQPR
jgi:hypothetical protein